MLELNIDDVLAVFGSVRTYLITVGVIVLIALLLTIGVNKKLVAHRSVRKLSHSGTWIVALTTIVVTMSMMLLSPLSKVLTLFTSARLSLTHSTIDKTNALAVNFEREGAVLLQNKENTLPISQLGRINVFGWASTNPIYGGTGSGALSDAYSTTSILDSLKSAGFTTNKDLEKFYADYSTTRGEISVTKADWTLLEPPATNYSQRLIDGAQ